MATVLRTGAILVVGAVALWIATGITLSLAIARQFPAVALAWWPASVTAKAAMGNATLMAGRPTPARIERTRTMLRGAALREPINTRILGTLGGIEDYRGDKAAARTMFRLSEAVSRRNNLTELWLIEDAVARNDIPAAIRHYDRAMRVSTDVRPMLLPILVRASADRDIRAALLPVLAQRPRWWSDFITELAASGGNARTIVAALGAVRLDIRNPGERLLAEAALTRMLALDEPAVAMRAANRLDGVPGTNRPLRDGVFDGSEGVLPFAWGLRDEAGVRAYRDTVPNGTLGLRIATTLGASGTVARQMIGLSPGRHILTGTIGNVAAATPGPEIELTCVGGEPFARFPLPQADDSGRRFRFAFEVPGNGCQVQSLTLAAAPTMDIDIWLDDLRITG